MEASQLTPLAQYLEDKKAIEDTISLLRRLGGSLEYNQFKDTMLTLEGILSGMRMCEFANNR